MQTPDHNRMASSQRRRGPPPGASVTPLPEPQKAEVVDVPQPPLTGIRCPSCGRHIVPRRDRVEGAAKCYAHCPICGVRMALTFEDGRPSTVRLIRPSGG